MVMSAPFQDTSLSAPEGHKEEAGFSRCLQKELPQIFSTVKDDKTFTRGYLDAAGGQVLREPEGCGFESQGCWWHSDVPLSKVPFTYTASGWLLPYLVKGLKDFWVRGVAPAPTGCGFES